MKRKELYVPETYYIIEEAHNFTKLKSFKNLFGVITREAAKYKLHFGFVTQYVADMPEEVLQSLGTKIIMPSEDTKEQLKDLEENLWFKKPDYVEFFSKKAKRFTAFLDYDKGLLTIKPPITKRELWLFSSEA
jgi:hypothetical protein